MSWIKPDSPTTRWRKRKALTVDNLAGVAGPKDANVNLSDFGDWFWDNLQGTDGDGLRVTTSDGVTEVPYELTGWDFADRVGTLEVDGLAIDGSAGLDKAWLYFDSSNAVVAAGSSVRPAPDGPLTVYGEKRKRHRGFRVLYRPPGRGATAPRTTFVKASADVAWVYFDFAGSLSTFGQTHNGAKVCEEITHAAFEVLLASADQSALRTLNAIRFFGTSLVRVTVKAGASGTTYTPSLTVKTSEGRTLNARCLLKVQDVDET